MTADTPAGTILALAAHPGDAARGAGASLSRRADTDRKVAIATLFAGGGDDAMVAARAEDERACLILNAEFAHRYLPDAARRGGDPAAMPGRDDPLSAELEREVSGLIDAYRPVAVWACAAPGGSVDRRLLRDVLHGLAPSVDVVWWLDAAPAAGGGAWRETAAAVHAARKAEACAAYRAGPWASASGTPAVASDCEHFATSLPTA